MKIKEVVVVEGKDDIARVKKALDCQVIATGGIYIDRICMENILRAYQKVGIIILTDPDYAGKKIRKRISSICPKAKHAFISREKAYADGDIGIENADPEEIRRAIEKSLPELNEKKEEFTMKDMLENGLSLGENSKYRREILADILGLAYGNTKTFLKNLNSFAISREDFEKALNKMEKMEEEDGK